MFGVKLSLSTTSSELRRNYADTVYICPSVGEIKSDLGTKIYNDTN